MPGKIRLRALQAQPMDVDPKPEEAGQQAGAMAAPPVPQPLPGQMPPPAAPHALPGPKMEPGAPAAVGARLSEAAAQQPNGALPGPVVPIAPHVHAGASGEHVQSKERRKGRRRRRNKVSRNFKTSHLQKS